jgi:NAD+ synthase (glutamine-hydrolysing)
MKVSIHQTHHTIADFSGVLNYLKSNFKDVKQTGLHVFPELFLTGYPLQDLCLQKSFIDSYLELLVSLNQWADKELKGDLVLLVGGLDYKLDDQGLPLEIKNVVYEIKPQQKLKVIYTKLLLPNYDIFDEKKYFMAGSEVGLYQYQDKQLGILICEDMWPSITHKIDPVKKLEKFDIDLVVNLSASPYSLRKKDKRDLRCSEISNTLSCPMIYVNRVGGEDEILFDGESFVVDGGEILHQAKKFEADTVCFDLALDSKKYSKKSTNTIQNTWEDLFKADLTSGEGSSLPLLNKLSTEECEELIQAISFGFQEYAAKIGFTKFLVALSGGIDSSLVLTIVKRCLKPGQSVEAIYMPSEYSADLSTKLSIELCKNLDVKLYNLPISDSHDFLRQSYGSVFGEQLSGLADENIQSRLRGTLLYSRSNATNSLVLNTSNKSELAVGYSTLYGDSVGAISLLGDVYKEEVFQLANFLNVKDNGILPQEIITRPPSAELRDDQKDSDTLPPYERLDAILEGLMSSRMSATDLIKSGHSKTEVELTFRLFTRSEYKRNQFCPIIKLRSKSFGFGHRVPICKSNSIYLK